MCFYCLHYREKTYSYEDLNTLMRTDVCVALIWQSRISHVDELLPVLTVTREIRNNEVLVLAFENGENEGLLATHDSNSQGG